MKTIFIICNSPEAFEIIATGAYEGICDTDIFTCNSAYTFFKTQRRHLNFFTDTIDIVRHVKMPEALSGSYEKKVEFIYSRTGATMATGQNLFPDLKKFSPVQDIGSSALNALAYLAVAEQYEDVYLIGYTIDESENPLWDLIAKYYDPARLAPGDVQLFKRKQ